MCFHPNQSKGSQCRDSKLQKGAGAKSDADDQKVEVGVDASIPRHLRERWKRNAPFNVITVAMIDYHEAGA